MTPVRYRTIDVEGLDVFYREAGNPEAPKLLLLHGFPSSSHMFRDLVPLLADRFHVVAPDLPGFGRTAMPSRDTFNYTFENLARVVGRFTELVGLDRFALYVFDYGAPTGFRIAMRHPDRIAAIISQNGNAYEEGLSDGWDPIRAYWREPSPANREALRAFLTPEATLWQYTHGVPDATAVSPDGYSLDNFYLSRPGADEIQLDLFRDYASNVATYPAFQDYFPQAPAAVPGGLGPERPLLPASVAGGGVPARHPEADARFFETGALRGRDARRADRRGDPGVHFSE